jgi:3-hydroxyisobutyrate dehydrogenase-like beta-hydroxyacid dehydrogenase
VTAGSALEVALAAAEYVREGQFFLDLNSVAPETKRIAANRFLPGAYLDVAVMAPVPPARLSTPLLIGRAGSRTHGTLKRPGAERSLRRG